ncbi:cleavage stimulation factor subunit 2 [Aplysia californica]|uniref:Cleavage stimulation factor subunit 2 n=1 Tax=Aplysia californica TaxID=6500 RepID=A0ABM0JBR1_APLCA|nr:cleavage stimulation factor subunit 2 [Aplysia californica]
MAAFAANFMPQDPNNSLSSSNTATAADRAQRSVFVGNIPYDATEEQLREVFIQAGPVVSFRLVYDRETGKPKGYGFCEYQDVETAQSAMRNLNNYDFNGRPLRVGVAAGEQNKDDGKSMQQALGGQIVESPYGEPVEPEKAPEAISKAVASLPPEQMFELMKQMKLCIQNNPNEARNMLLQNPQLAYALLQAQIVMKIVDPQVAMSMLYRDESQPQINVPTGKLPQQGMGQRLPGGVGMPMGNMPRPIRPPQVNVPQMAMPPRPDMMMMRPAVPQGKGDMGEPRRFPQPNVQGSGPAPRMQPPTAPPGLPQPQRPPASQAASSSQPSSSSNPAANGAANISAQDQEKAALIMQVLQLTDDQIALLPPEQRQSILILKEQIKSG